MINKFQNSVQSLEAPTEPYQIKQMESKSAVK